MTRRQAKKVFLAWSFERHRRGRYKLRTRDATTKRLHRYHQRGPRPATLPRELRLRYVGINPRNYIV